MLPSWLIPKMGNRGAHSDELMQSQVLVPINYLNQKCYIISKESYDFIKPSDKQIIGRLKSEETCYVISKETYKYLRNEQQNTSSLQLMQQVLGPINYQKSEIYVIGEALQKKVKNRIRGEIKINEEYYVISEETYKEHLSQNDQKKKQQLSLQL